MLTDNSRDTKISPWSVAVGILIIALPFAFLQYLVYQRHQAENHLDKTLQDAPVISISQTDANCGSGKPVALNLVTGAEDIAGAAVKSIARPQALMVLQKEKISGGGRTSYQIDWIDYPPQPSQFILYSPDHKMRLNVQSNDVDFDLLPVIYEAPILDTANPLVLPQWQSIKPEQKIAEYKIRALPCGARVFVVGVLSKSAAGYKLSGYTWQGVEQKVIVKVESGVGK